MDQFEIILLCSTLLMTGIIWVIQLVHYPSFCFIAAHDFEKFCKFHQKNITLIVLPLMLIELVFSLIILTNKFHDKSYVLSMAFLLVIWIVTIFVSVPLHRLLLKEKSDVLITRLIRTNWYRTIGWTLRTLLLVYIYN
jgi:hypothetical protein